MAEDDDDDDEAFQPGDIVVLKSGGPDMTVREVVGNPPVIYVSWFDSNTKMDSSFPAIMLEFA